VHDVVSISEIKKLGVSAQTRGQIKYTVPTIHDPATKRAVMGSEEALHYPEERCRDHWCLKHRVRWYASGMFISEQDVCLLLSEAT
jgi:hypothetical protein